MNDIINYIGNDILNQLKKDCLEWGSISGPITEHEIASTVNGLSVGIYLTICERDKWSEYDYNFELIECEICDEDGGELFANTDIADKIELLIQKNF